MTENTLLAKIKTIFLFFLTLLVFVNTLIIASLLPALGHYFAPYNQEVAVACKIVILAMESCMVAIIMLGVAYGTVKVLGCGKKTKYV